MHDESRERGHDSPNDEIAKLRAELEEYRRALADARAAVPIAAQQVVEHIPGVTQCSHVDHGDGTLTPWGLVRVQTLPGCDYRGQPLTLAVVACALCAGRAFGSMSMADAEHGMTRDEMDAATREAGEVLGRANAEPSHRLAVGLMELGGNMARELGKRPT